MSDNQSVTSIDLSQVRTKSGKSIQDFTIPENLFESDQELIKLVMESEAMNDGEKQYWFNLTKVMNNQQKEKLYDILRRERKKLNEIRGKTPQNPEEIAEARKKAEEQARLRAQRQAEIEAKEKAQRAQQGKEEEILGALDW